MSRMSMSGPSGHCHFGEQEMKETGMESNGAGDGDGGEAPDPHSLIERVRDLERRMDEYDESSVDW
jgi:hypothetical protein